MSTKPYLDADDARRTAYSYGRALVDTKPTEASAHQRAGTYERHYPASETGLEFIHALYTPSHPTVVLDENGARVEATTPEVWGVYAEPVPLLEYRQARTLEVVTDLMARLARWDTPVLVRRFKDSGSARTTTHRDNTKTRTAWETLARVAFRTRTIGLGMDRTHGEYAFLDGG